MATSVEQLADSILKYGPVVNKLRKYSKIFIIGVSWIALDRSWLYLRDNLDLVQMLRGRAEILTQHAMGQDKAAQKLEEALKRIEVLEQAAKKPSEQAEDK